MRNRPWKPEEVRSYILSFMRYETPKTFDSRKAGALTGAMNKLCGGDVRRRILLGYIFGVSGEQFSTSMMTPQMWLGVSKWLDQQLIDGKWRATSAAKIESRWILEHVLGEVQLELPGEDNYFKFSDRSWEWM